MSSWCNIIALLITKHNALHQLDTSLYYELLSFFFDRQEINFIEKA
jgi:hypothetical protein